MKSLFKLITIVSALILSLTSCNKEDESYTITVGVFSQELDGSYTASGEEITFYSNQECQTWTRTAQADSHSAGSHLHYNAAGNVSYNNDTKTFNWTEYGPEIDQASIESTCSAGQNGVSKSVNDTDYYEDKPGVFMKIVNVE